MVTLSEGIFVGPRAGAAAAEVLSDKFLCVEVLPSSGFPWSGSPAAQGAYERRRVGHCQTAARIFV